MEIDYNHLSKVIAKLIVKNINTRNKDKEIEYEDDNYILEFDYHLETDSEYDDDFVFFIYDDDVYFEFNGTELDNTDYDIELLETKILYEFEKLLGITKHYNKDKKQNIKKFNIEKED